MNDVFDYRIGFAVRAQIIDMLSENLERKDVYGVVVGYHTYNDGNVINVKCLDTGKIVAVDAENVYPVVLNEYCIKCMGFEKSNSFDGDYVKRIIENNILKAQIYYNVDKHRLTILMNGSSVMVLFNISYMHQFQIALDLVGLDVGECMCKKLLTIKI